MDYIISPYPIRTFSPMADASRLRVKSLMLVGAGHLPGRTMRRVNAAFDHWAFVYITGGRGDYRAGDGPVQPVEAGTLFCLYPGTLFQYGPEPGGYWDEYYFTVEGPRVAEWLGSWLPDPHTVKFVGKDESAAARMERIFAMMESGSPVQLDQAALLLESLLYGLAAGAPPSEPRVRSRNAPAVIDGLGAMLYGPTDAKQIAAAHHMSVSTLRRIVQAYSGYPLHDYLHRLKAAEAGRLLLNTDFTVREIGEKLGYRDPFYFSRLFKRIMGCAPRDYRIRNGR